jgi:low temperature requirement protein LtrA
MTEAERETADQEPSRAYRYARGPALHGHHRVSYVELFFDLVFVYAITQLSHHLIAHPSLLGLFETAMLTAAVWWVWIYTSWATNWADPDKMPVRIMLFCCMAAGLVMSISIPGAFGERAMTFAFGFVAMHLGRSYFMYSKVMGELSPVHKQNFLLLSLWLTGTAVFWIGGALVGGTAQIVLWSIAVVIDYAGPAMRFAIPGLGRSDIRAWTVEPGHFAERCALFIIICLGESILVTGATFEKLPSWSFETVMAFIGAFTATVGMWAIYFNIGVERGAHAMRLSDETGLVARAYTYVHLLIVGGIIVTAVGDEFALAHATGHADAKTIAALIGGPFLYVAGCAIFKRATAGWYPLSHTAGLGMLALLGYVGTLVEPWVLTLLTSAVLIIIAIWEQISLGPDAVHKIGHPRERAKSEELQP